MEVRLNRDVVGLSPLARGNLPITFPVSILCGPIPARAGEPNPLIEIRCGVRAYPRSRGGTVWSIWRPVAVLGLSPLARGNPGAAGQAGGH